MYTTRNQITRPNVLVTNREVLANESISAETFISAFDPDGYPITKYYLRDDSVDNSYFMLGNTQIPQGTFFTINADQLANLRYYGNGQGSETVRAFAYDGSTWSVVGIGTLTTRPNLNRPTVNFTQLQVPTRELTSISNTLSFQDADGNSIKGVRIWDTSSHTFSGYLLKDGETLAPKQWHEMTLNEFADLQYVGAERQMNEVFAVRVYDGRYWSPVERIVFKTIFRPEIGSERQLFKRQLITTDVQEMFDKLDAGPAHEKFQIVDMSVNLSSGADISGYLTQGAGKLSPFTVHEMTVSEFNATTFVSGPYEATQTDELYARAYNGVYWSEWTRVEVNTHPEFDRALVNPIGTNNLLEWNDFSAILPAPSVISYSFMQQFPSYDSGDATADTFSRFTSDMRGGARRAFGLIEQYANVEFVEVADSVIDPNTGGLGGIIRMGVYSDDSDGAPAAYAFLPGFEEVNGDIWINRAKMGIIGWQDGSSDYMIFMHELGHAMGYKHSFDGTPALPTSTDTNLYTVMSYTGRFDNLSPATYALYDIYSFQQLYGANMDHAVGDDVYSIANTWQRQDAVWAIWDADGNDTLSAEGATNDAVVDLRDGRLSSIGTATQNIAIAIGAKIENAIGSNNDDQLIGNELGNTLQGGLGNDLIRGMGGNDMLMGGKHNDIYQLGIGDGRDTIDEQRQAGWDSISFRNFPGFDDFMTDLSFRREDRDLIIEYTMDEGLSQGSVRIENQKWGSYRIESLTIGSTTVDLTNLFAQATGELQQFRTINQTSNYGSLVVPV